MQNRYVGDVGDFAKYALLRSISVEMQRLGIVWCLIGDESHNADGRHTTYLVRGEFRDLDAKLHDALALLVKTDRRSVRQIIRAGIFRRDSVSFALSPTAPDPGRLNGTEREQYRSKWLSAALLATTPCDLVFFDPDNGIETRSVPKHASKAGKYIFWDELRLFWNRGQSLVIYHHLNRTASAREQTRVLRDRFAAEFQNSGFSTSLLFRRGSCRHFWIVGQERHTRILKSAIDAMLGSGWAKHFEAG